MDYYHSLNIFDLKENFTIDELKKKFYKKALLYHPDKNNSEFSKNEFINYLNAYNFLKNYKNNNTKTNVNDISLNTNDISLNTNYYNVNTDNIIEFFDDIKLMINAIYNIKNIISKNSNKNLLKKKLLKI